MTEARKMKLTALAAQPDTAIDLTEIPELPESFWKNAVRNPFYRPIKQQLTVRLDADVVAWLKQQGRGFTRSDGGHQKRLGVCRGFRGRDRNPGEPAICRESVPKA